MKTDSQLQQDVMEELKWEPKVDHSQIGVTAKDGVITLSGSVPSYAQKLAAEQAARAVCGVRAVAQDIEVRFGVHAKPTDAEIAKHILDRFNWDVTIPDKLTVKVEHGWVTLGGQVDWNYQKNDAFKAASKVNGVLGVVNAIEVKATPTPKDIRQRIEAAFKRSSAVDASAIQVEVDGSTVKLKGHLHGWNERRTAENAAWAAPGITKVEDEIVLA